MKLLDFKESILKAFQRGKLILGALVFALGGRNNGIDSQIPALSFSESGGQYHLNLYLGGKLSKDFIRSVDL